MDLLVDFYGSTSIKKLDILVQNLDLLVHLYESTSWFFGSISSSYGSILFSLYGSTQRFLLIY